MWEFTEEWWCANHNVNTINTYKQNQPDQISVEILAYQFQRQYERRPYDSEYALGS